MALAEAGNTSSCQFEFVHEPFDAVCMSQGATLETPHAILMSAVLPTWARLPHCDPTGPPPIRSRAWPWGFPWLKHQDQLKADQDNAKVHAMLELLRRVLAKQPGTPLIIVAPEDLGRVRRSFPASLWQLRGLREAAREYHCYRAAFHQCQFGHESFSRPTGVLSSFRLPSRTVKLGWPRFDAARSFAYAGPLGPTCRCNKLHQSMLKAGGAYKSQPGSLSQGSLAWLAANLIQQALIESGADSSPLRKGLYYWLEPPFWAPEQPEADSDATVEEELLWPPAENSDDSEGQVEFLRACERARRPWQSSPRPPKEEEEEEKEEDEKDDHEEVEEGSSDHNVNKVIRSWSFVSSSFQASR